MLPPALSKADIRLLHVFATIVEAKGFSAAQITLNVSASSISRQISELEARLSMKLCHRGRGGFRMTPQGEAVYQAAQKVFSALGDFRATIDGTRGQLSGILSIAVVDNWIFNTKAPILPALTAFVTSAPQVEYELYSLAPDDIERSVLDEKIAIGFGVFHQHKPGLVYETIGKERIGLYCAATHPVALAQDLDEAERRLNTAGFVRRAYLDEDMVAPVSRRLASNAVAHQIEGIAMLILTGKYIGYLPESYASLWLEKGQMVPVSSGLHDRETDIKLIRKREHDTNPLLQAFYKLIRHEVSHVDG